MGESEKGLRGTTSVRKGRIGEKKKNEELERKLLEKMLEKYDWDVDKVARVYGAHRNSIIRKMKECGIDSPKNGMNDGNAGDI